MIKIEDCQNPQAIKVNTDFNIQLDSEIKATVEQIDGVETIDTFSVHKYSFLVTFGKLFNKETIKEQIRKKLCKKK